MTLTNKKSDIQVMYSSRSCSPSPGASFVVLKNLYLVTFWNHHFLSFPFISQGISQNQLPRMWLYSWEWHTMFQNTVALTGKWGVSTGVCVRLRVNKWPKSKLIPCQVHLHYRFLIFLFPLPFALPFLLHMENLYQDGCHGNGKICMCLIYLFKYLLMVYNSYDTSLQLCSSLI